MKSFLDILKFGVETYDTRSVLDNLTVDQIIECVEEYAKQFSASQFKKFPENKPEPDTKVIAVLDYTKYGRGRRAVEANVHISDKYEEYGGPSAVIGKGKIPPNTIYFSIPAIIPPEIVTHWMLMPELPES